MSPTSILKSPETKQKDKMNRFYEEEKGLGFESDGFS